jgi:hypothetical protein
MQQKITRWKKKNSKTNFFFLTKKKKKKYTNNILWSREHPTAKYEAVYLDMGAVEASGWREVSWALRSLQGLTHVDTVGGVVLWNPRCDYQADVEVVDDDGRILRTQ